MSVFTEKKNSVVSARQAIFETLTVSDFSFRTGNDAPQPGDYLQAIDINGRVEWTAVQPGNGDVSLSTNGLPVTDNQIVRFDGLSGKIIQGGKAVTINDDGDITTPAGAVTAGNGVTVTGGNIVAAVGDVTATVGAVTAGNGVTATKGNITATEGDIVAELGNITATEGDIVAEQGDITATVGAVTAGAGVTATKGDITATGGDIVAGVGDVIATKGDIVAELGNITATVGNVTAGTFVSATTYVSLSSTGYADDADASKAGVPLGGLYLWTGALLPTDANIRMRVV